MEVKFRPTNPLLADYLRYLFPPLPDGRLKVKSSHDVGRLIISYCRTSATPVDTGEGDMLTFVLPKTHITQNFVHKFLYIPAIDMNRINLALQAVFNLDFAVFMQKGLSAEFSKTELIDAFITSRGLVTTDNFEALHKKEYRLMQRKKESIFHKLYRKSSYIQETIDFSVKKKQQL